MPEQEIRRILVVDDEQDVADSLAIMLSLEGHDVKVAYDGETALALVVDFIPHVILVDLGMPRMDGYALARKLRQRKELARAQLVAVSGYAQPSDRERSRDAGIHHHLAKPVDPRMLLAFIDELGDPARGRRALGGDA